MGAPDVSPDETPALDARPIPDARLIHAGQVPKRRLDDALEEVFRRACDAGNLEAAEDLLSVLEKWNARRVTIHGVDRRINDTGVRAMRTELERLMASRPV